MRVVDHNILREPKGREFEGRKQEGWGWRWGTRRDTCRITCQSHNGGKRKNELQSRTSLLARLSERSILHATSALSRPEAPTTEGMSKARRKPPVRLECAEPLQHRTPQIAHHQPTTHAPRTPDHRSYDTEHRASQVMASGHTHHTTQNAQDTQTLRASRNTTTRGNTPHTAYHTPHFTKTLFTDHAIHPPLTITRHALLPALLRPPPPPPSPRRLLSTTATTPSESQSDLSCAIV